MAWTLLQMPPALRVLDGATVAQSGHRVADVTHWMNAVSNPGNLVCDPCLAGAMTAVAAYLGGRRFVGCDVDTNAIKIGRRRLRAVELSKAS